MASSMYEVEKFTGVENFRFWKLRMRAKLQLQGLASALDGPDKMSPTLTPDEKQSIIEEAHCELVLSLGDSVLRQVLNEETAQGVWDKLEDLYTMKNTHANRCYLKLRLFSFRVTDEKPILDQVEEFLRIIDDLEYMDSKYTDEDQAMMLLIALPESLDTIKNALVLGGKSTLALKDVISALESVETRKCYRCKKFGHLRKDCSSFKKNRKGKGERIQSN